MENNHDVRSSKLVGQKKLYYHLAGWLYILIGLAYPALAVILFRIDPASDPHHCPSSVTDVRIFLFSSTFIVIIRYFLIFVFLIVLLLKARNWRYNKSENQNINTIFKYINPVSFFILFLLFFAALLYGPPLESLPAEPVICP